MLDISTYRALRPYIMNSWCAWFFSPSSFKSFTGSCSCSSKVAMLNRWDTTLGWAHDSRCCGDTNNKSINLKF